MSETVRVAVVLVDDCRMEVQRNYVEEAVERAVEDSESSESRRHHRKTSCEEGGVKVLFPMLCRLAL